jgi:hypothetical protein
VKKDMRGHPKDDAASQDCPEDRKSFTIQADSRCLALVGSFLGTLEGTLQRRPFTKFGRKLPAAMWDRCHVVMQDGRLMVNKMDTASKRLNSSSSHDQGCATAAGVEEHQVSQIVRIEYARHGDRSFKIHLRDVNNLFSQAKEVPTTELSSEELRATGRRRSIPVIALEFRASSAQAAMMWIHRLLLEVSAHAKLTTELVKVLVNEDPHAPAAEALLRRAVSLWKLAFGDAAHVVQAMQNLVDFLLAQPNRFADAEEVQSWIAEMRDQAPADHTPATDTEQRRTSNGSKTSAAEGASRSSSKSFFAPSSPRRPSFFGSSSARSLRTDKSLPQSRERQLSAMDDVRALAYATYLDESARVEEQFAEEEREREARFKRLMGHQDADTAASLLRSRQSSQGASYTDLIGSLL